jgi:hypothetical protein
VSDFTRDDLRPLLTTIFGDERAFAGLFSGRRVNGRLTDQREQYLAFPAAEASIHSWLAAEVAAGREVYLCAHPLKDRRRKKEHATLIRALYADVDTGTIPTGALAPTLVIESSPGRYQAYWMLTQPVAPAKAEVLNRRLATLIGADASGYDLTQLLRVPGTPNRKYADAPTVRTIAYHPERVFDPEKLEYALPSPPTQRRAERAERAVCADDEPPIELDGLGLETYRGQRPKVKRDGTGQVDRSASLLKVGRVLYDGGMTRRGLVDALAERDQGLGYIKYTGRADAAEQYHRIVDQLESEGRRQRPQSPPAPVAAQASDTTAPGDSCPARLAAALREIVTLRAESTRLAEEKRMLVLTMTNPHLKAEAATIVPAVMETHRQRQAGNTDDKGFVLLSPARLGDDHAANPAPIRSRSTASRHLAKAAELGLLERDVRPGVVDKIVRTREGMPVLDPKTGKPRRKPFTTEQTWIRLTGESIAEMLKPFALFAPAEGTAERDITGKHGGDRRSAAFQATRHPCPECGGTERHTYCGACGTDITKVAEAEIKRMETTVQHETRRRRRTLTEEGTAFQDATHKRRPPPPLWIVPPRFKMKRGLVIRIALTFAPRKARSPALGCMGSRCRA